MIIIKYWRIVGILQYYLPFMDGQYLHQIQKREICRKWKIHFWIFSNGTMTIFFHYIWASIKAAPDIGGIGIQTPRNWNHFSKMNRIFGHFRPPQCWKGGKGRGRSWYKNQNSPMGHQIWNWNPRSALSLKLFEFENFFQNEWNWQAQF